MGNLAMETGCNNHKHDTNDGTRRPIMLVLLFLCIISIIISIISIIIIITIHIISIIIIIIILLPRRCCENVTRVRSRFARVSRVSIEPSKNEPVKSSVKKKHKFVRVRSRFAPNPFRVQTLASTDAQPGAPRERAPILYYTILHYTIPPSAAPQPPPQPPPATVTSVPHPRRVT